jgi:hypothetical protein
VSAEVRLAGGRIALVDHEDVDLVGQRCWYAHRSDTRVYAMAHRRFGTTRAMHRLILQLDDPELFVDHINGDGLDNRRANLRVVTARENAQNQGPRKGRFRGVSFDKSRGLWIATATLDGKRTTIGRFETEEQAGAAASAWRSEHMPFSQEVA